MARVTELTVLAGKLKSTLVLSLRHTQALNEPLSMRVRFVAANYVSPSETLGKTASVYVKVGNQPVHRTLGVVSSITLVGTPQLEGSNRIAPTYELTIESILAPLRGIVDSRIFQEKTTKDIVTSVLDEASIPADYLDFRCRQTPLEHRFAVRYQEDSLSFASRLLEDDGTYFFESTGGEEQKLVFDDTSTAATERLEGPLHLREAAGFDGDEPAVFSVERRVSVRPGAVALASYSFKKALRLESTATRDEHTELEHYSFSEPFLDDARGKELATRRLEELAWQKETFSIVTDCLAIEPGDQLKIVESEMEEPKAYFIIGRDLRHRYEAHDRSDGSAGGEESLYVHLTAIPLAVPYRPLRRHPKRRMDGPQTATVVAPPSTEAEGLCTDKHGRVKVKFHWDRYGANDDSACCFLRIGQLQTSGSVVLPRVGWEVLVDFIDGDPDRPIVAGRLCNKQFMPPYALPEGKTRMSLQTSSSPGGGGRNEVRFEDAAGAEELMINSQYNTAIVVAHDRKKNITKNETIIIGNNAQLEVGGNQTIKVTNGSEATIDADQSLSVGGNRTHEVNAVSGLTVAGTSEVTVGGNWMAMIGSPLDALIALGTAKAAEIASQQADKAFAAVSGAMQSGLDQITAPLQGLTAQVDSLQGSLNQVADGQLSASAGELSGAVAIPTASDMMRSFAQGPAMGRAADGTETSSGQIALSSMVSGLVTGKLQEAKGAMKEAYDAATGSSGEAMAGSAEANQGGPAGDLGGFTAEDKAKGPGYAQYKVTGSYKETVGGMRLVASLEAVNRNIKASMTDTVGAATIEVIKGARAESVEGASSETEPAMVIATKGDEVETVHGARQLTVGGAVMEQVGGNYTIEAAAALTMVGAMHNMKAKSKITFKCGASSVVLDGSGVTIQAPVVNMTASAVAAPKAVSDG
jgi:type VI secretion system secreted protein VgrG